MKHYILLFLSLFIANSTLEYFDFFTLCSNNFIKIYIKFHFIHKFHFVFSFIFFNLLLICDSIVFDFCFII